ncbi:MAG: Ig-like domain-containing protein [Deltaproteobacteria bacterium]|nr:Ig-like domain-containing protein [Deltaproteobacteria bacterium]
MTGLRKYGPLFIIVCLGLLISLVTLTSCGGGGSSNNAPLPPEPSPTVPANILLGSKWSIANVDAVQAATIYAQVIAQNGKTVPDGTQIKFTADQGYWNNTQTEITTTTMGGIASASLTFGRTISQTTQVGVTVRALGVTGVFATTSVVFYSSATASYQLGLSATPTAIKSDGTGRSLIKVKFTNGAGVAVPDAQINLAASLGGFFPGGTPPATLPATYSLITDKNGEASVYYTYINPSTIDTTVPNITALITAQSNYVDPILGQTIKVGNSILITLTPNVIIPGSIKLTCPVTTLNVGGNTTIITATVLDTKGNPMPAGYTVNFTATLGSITGLGVTNASGIATAVLTSGFKAGPCVVTGTAGGVSDSLTVVFLQANPLTIAPPLTTFTIGTANQVTLTANGGSGSVTFTMSGAGAGMKLTYLARSATVTYDGSATPAGDVIVTANDTLTGETAQAVIRMNPAALTIAPSSANILTGTGQAITLNFTATGGSGTYTWAINMGTVTGSFTFNSSGNAARLIYNGGPATPGDIIITLTDAKTGETTQAIVHVGAAGALGIGPLNSTFTIGTAGSVDFTVTNGSGTFTWTTSFAISADAAQDERGALPAGFTFASSGRTATLAYDGSAVSAGIITVTVTDTITKETATGYVSVKSGGGVSVVNTVTLNSNPAAATQLPADGASYYTIFATAQDQNGKAVPNVTITFTSNLGTFCPTLPIAGCASSTGVITAVTNNNGVATVYLVSSQAGTANVAASSANGITSATLSFTFTGGGQVVTVNEIVLTAAPATIKADGVSTSTITALCRNLNKNPIPNAQVNFTVSPLGTIPAQATTDANGIATVKLTSERLNTPLAGTVVTATSGATKSSIPVAFTGATLVVGSLPLTLNTANLSTITATLKDASGNPVVGQQLVLTNTAGTLSSQTGITDTNGQVAVTLGSNVAATITVTVQVSGPASQGNTATTSVTFTNATFTIDWAPKPSPLVVSTLNNVTLTATVTDINGNPIAGRGITFSTTLGSLSPLAPVVLPCAGVTSVSTVTNGAGIATCFMMACTNSGTATVTARDAVTSATVQTNIDIAAAVAALICVTEDPPVIPTTTGQATISARVYDGGVCAGPLGNPVANAPVAFRITHGPGGGEYLSPGVITTDKNGLATTTLFAGTVPSSSGVTIKDVTISATVNALAPATTSLIIAGNPFALSLGYDTTPDCTCQAPQGHCINNFNGTVTLKITAIVSDINGNPVADGVWVYFDTDTGIVTKAVTTSGGIASNSVTYNDSTAPTSIQVTATAGGIIKSILVPTTRCNIITISASPAAFSIGTGSSITITLNGGSGAFTINSVTYGAGVCTGAPTPFDCKTGAASYSFKWTSYNSAARQFVFTYDGSALAAGNISIQFKDLQSGQLTSFLNIPIS